MRRQLLSVSLAALLIAGGSFAAAQAQQGQPGQQGQQGGPGMMMQQERQVDRPEGAQATGDRQRRAGQRGMRDRGYRHGMMHRGMGRDYGMRGRGGRGGMHAMRGMGGQHREHMLRTLIILMDTDGDGTLSLEEVQAVTERFFNAMDADGDGQLTIEEIRNFYTMRGAMPGLDDDVDLDDDDNDDDDDNGNGPGGN